ncbi:MAG: ComF family protein [Casimicrobiaceae bacterium]
MSNFFATGFDNFARWRRLPATLLPQRCVLCVAASGAQLLCDPCARTLPPLPPHCPQCALPTAAGSHCGRCLTHPPAFVATRCAFAYAYPIVVLVHALKYGGRTAHAAIFAEALAALPALRPDCLVPLPLSTARQRERGYNQAAEIARHLGRLLGLPVVEAIRRTRDTAPQATLPLTQRQANVRAAFAVTPVLSGARIAIVDDVMTTGATLDAAARAARAAGARTVEAWIGARTLPPGFPS